MITVQHMAQVCREAMRSFGHYLGDFHVDDWHSLTDRQRRTSIGIVESILDNGDISPMKLHEAWVDTMVHDEGWTFGDLNEQERTHPNIREWEDLPQHVQTSYAISIGIVRGMRDVAMTVRGVPWSPSEVRHMTGQETFTPGLGEEQTGPSEYEEER